MSLNQTLSDLRHAAEAGVAAAAEVLDMANREILNVPAPLELVGGRLVAASPAEPGAPPRRVTGRLQVHATRYEVGNGAWFVGVFGVPYGAPLEFSMGHPFIAVTFREQQAAMQDAAARGIREALA